MENRDRMRYRRDFGGKSRVVSRRAGNEEPLWLIGVAGLVVVITVLLLIFYVAPVAL